MSHDASSRPLRTLVFTTVWPTVRCPQNGLFVRKRTESAMTVASVAVVAPVSVRLAMRQGGRETLASCCDTSHPVFWYVPGVAKCLDGLWLFLSSVRTVARLKRRFGFDLIDAHFGYPDGFAAALLGLMFRRPFVVTFRGSELVMARFSARRSALRFVAKRASCVVAVSTELEQLAHNLGADKRRTIVIGNGVDVDQFAPLDRLIARARLGCSASGSIVLCVGHLARVKRFDLVLDAFSILRNRNMDVTLAIVGGDGAADRGYGETLKARARALGVKDAVLFPGAVDPADVSLWMNAADVLVLPSEREGSPNVVLEALATGTPVVASDVGDVRRLITSSNGVLMSSNPTQEDVADAIAAVLEHGWDRDRISQTVASQTWRTVGERVVSMWRAAVTGAGEAHGVPAQC